MVKVIIDGIAFETLSKASVVMSFDAQAMCDVDKARDVVDVEVEIVCDTVALSMFGGEGYLHAAERFNANQHLAQICYESVVVFEGDVTLRSATRCGEKVVYTLRVRRSGAWWAVSAATTLLSDLDVDYENYLTEHNIEQSWGSDDIVKFFPVHRDSYSDVYSSTSDDVVNRVLSIDEYHPFINIYKVLDTIFSKAGYEVESTILESDWFKKLYMSGQYTSQYGTTARTTMDFYVSKLESVSSTADYRGRVSMSPYVASNTVGNFVDVESIDTNAECYSRSGCLKEVDGAVCFTPLTQVSVGFEYRFRYITEYKIKSRTELTAFDTFYLESGDEIRVGVANNFVDQRDQRPISNFEYNVVIFDHEPWHDVDLRYRLYISDASSILKIVEWDSRTTSFTSPNYASPSEVVYGLFVSDDGGDIYYFYDGDWAIYQGFVGLTGQKEVDVTLRTPPQSVSPSSPKSFGGHYIDGAEAGMTFTLLAGTTLSPYFASYPGVGSSVKFEDLAQLGIHQSGVVSAVQHLFNLRFYTDHMAKKVYVESLEAFYDASRIWDWTSKIVGGEPIVYEDVACEEHKIRRWGYQPSDGATTRSQEFGYEPGESYPDAPAQNPEQEVDGSWSELYGAWSFEIGNYGALQSSRSNLNPLFSPTLNDTNGLPIVGDRDDAELTDTLEFSPRILSFLGMQSFGNDTIPYTAFHAPSHDFTLCFEDRDDVVGLNRYYAEQVARDASSQYVTLVLQLSPLEMAALLSPVDGMASVMSTFTFEIDGEWCVCRMESMVKYDIATSVAICKFLIIK